jgi:hypothetical protein
MIVELEIVRGSNGNSFGSSAASLETVDMVVHRPVPTWKFGVSPQSMMAGAIK